MKVVRHIARVRDAALLLAVAVYSAGLATLGMIALLVVLVWEVLARTWRWVPTALDLPLLGLVLAVLASIVASEWRAVTLDLIPYFLFTVLVSINPVAAYVRDGVDRAVRLLVIWVTGGAVAAAWGLTQPRPAERTLASIPFIHQNALGTTLAVAAILALGLLLCGMFRRRWPWILGLAVLLVGLIATLARAAWLGAAAGVVTLTLIGARPRTRLALALVCATLLGLAWSILPRWPMLQAEVRSITSLEANRNRLALWRSAPKIVADHPVLGTGYGTFRFVYPRYRLPDAPEPDAPFAHNIFLNFAVETGLLGLLAFAGLCASGLVATWRWLRRSPPASPGRGAATAVLAALVAFLTNQLFEGTAVTVHVGFGLLVLLAIGAAGERYLTPATVAAARYQAGAETSGN